MSEWKALLALDVDGVLHGTDAGDDALLTKLPLLEAWLREHTSVGIVVTSSWRHTYSLEQLRDFFSSDVQHQVIGVTGTYWKWVFEETGEVPLTVTHERLHEMQQWMRDHDAAGTPRAALDDEPGQFGAMAHRVIVCESRVGLQAHHLEALERLLDVQQ